MAHFEAISIKFVTHQKTKFVSHILIYVDSGGWWCDSVGEVATTSTLVRYNKVYLGLYDNDFISLIFYYGS